MARIKKEFIENGIRYFVRSNPSGYGFEIIKTTEVKYGKSSCIFRTLNLELVHEIFDAFVISENKNTFIFPNTSNELDMLKVLKIESKHSTDYYSVPTHTIFHKVLRKYLTDEYASCIDNMKPIIPKNKTGVISEEEILSIPIKPIRDDIKIKWDIYCDQLKSYNNDMIEWENLKAVVTTETEGIALDAMNFYESNYEHITLTKIE